MMDIEEEITITKGHIEQGNYHAGLNLDISAMNACRFLIMMKDIVNTMAEGIGSQS